MSGGCAFLLPCHAAYHTKHPERSALPRHEASTCLGRDGPARVALDELCWDAVTYDQERGGETERTAGHDQNGHSVGASPRGTVPGDDLSLAAGLERLVEQGQDEERRRPLAHEDGILLSALEM